MVKFNPWGFLFLSIIMIPNIIFAIKNKEAFENSIQKKWFKILEIFEQIGRYGCFFCMMFDISGTYFGFSSNFSFRIYLIINGILIFSYCLIWITHFRKNNLFRGISLSVIPSIIFLFSGIISKSILLIIFAIIFAPCHIAISILNTKR
ncbi:MAG: hypothetical protein E7064_08755 [Spirochaetaceae bacterium]|nr:hypothetical protein [Spirochaetaceae bacterium]